MPKDVKYLLVGSSDAMRTMQPLVDSASASGWNVACRELDPAQVKPGLFGRFFAKRKLYAAAKEIDPLGVVILVEKAGDTAWQPWMVYAIGGGLRQIAVPSRLKGQDNIAGSRSGVAVYDKLNSLEDLDEIYRSTCWEAEKLAYVSH